MCIYAVVQIARPCVELHLSKSPCASWQLVAINIQSADCVRNHLSLQQASLHSPRSFGFNVLLRCSLSTEHVRQAEAIGCSTPDITLSKSTSRLGFICVTMIILLNISSCSYVCSMNEPQSYRSSTTTKSHNHHASSHTTTTLQKKEIAHSRPTKNESCKTHSPLHEPL
jgi:hypothetical protein